MVQEKKRNSRRWWGKGLLRKLMELLLGREEDGIFYINGPETLPPPLSREEEEKVFTLLESDTAKAREELIVHNLRLVVYIARKFESTGVGIEDLISIGTSSWPPTPAGASKTKSLCTCVNSRR